MSKEANSCPACGCKKTNVYLPKCGDIIHRNPGTWSLVECDGCQVIYTTPQLNAKEILQYYPKEYASYNVAAGLRKSFSNDIFRKIIMSPYWLRYGSPEWGEKPFGQSTLLEIGCGTGIFMKKMFARGWKCTGIDISPVAVEWAMKNIPEADVSQSSLADYSTEQRYDMIVMSQVLEHFSDPVESLKKSFNLLRPSGKLFIGIPNIGSFEAKLFGRYWRGLDIPRHMVHFREPVLLRLLERCGFVIENVRPAMFASSVSESVILALPSAMRNRLLHSSSAHLLYLLAIFPAALSYLFGNRGIIEIIAKRPN